MNGLDLPGENHINPVHRRSVVIRISHILEWSGIGINEYLNEKDKMQAEYQRETRDE